MGWKKGKLVQPTNSMANTRIRRESGEKMSMGADMTIAAFLNSLQDGIIFKV